MVTVLGYMRLIKLEQNQSDKLTIGEHVHADIENRISESDANFTSIRMQLDELKTKQDVIADVVNQPVEEQIHINEDYALAEVEHLLIIASYNLQLSHDIAMDLLFNRSM